MNFYWRQTIVGLLRHIAVTMPDLAEESRRTAEQLDRTLTQPWLEKAFSLFQAATARAHDPIYLTGAFYASRALDELRRFEERASAVRGEAHIPETGSGAGAAPAPAPATTPAAEPPDSGAPAGAAASAISAEADKGILELFDRIRHGATLEEALSLFPHLGDEADETGGSGDAGGAEDTGDTDDRGAE